MATTTANVQAVQQVPAPNCYNKMIGKLAGMTFEVVKKLEMTDEDSLPAKVSKFAIAFLATMSIIPMVGLFAAAGASRLLGCICGRFAKGEGAPQQPPTTTATVPQQTPADSAQPPVQPQGAPAPANAAPQQQPAAPAPAPVANQ